jgi:hypothetical protein
MPEDGTETKAKLQNKEKSETLSFYEGLKNEWSLFWDNIIEDEVNDAEKAEHQPEIDKNEKDPFLTGKIEKLSLIQLKEITKALSMDRKILNQKLESINKELDLNNAKLESLKLVGSDYSDTEARIHELTNLGHQFSERLNLIDERIKKARSIEKNLKQT